MGNYRISTKQNAMIWLELWLLTALCVFQFLGIPEVCLAVTLLVGLYMVLTRTVDDTVMALFVALPMFNLFNYRIGNISMYYLFVFVFWYKYFKASHWRISGVKLLVLLALLALRLTSGELRDNTTWFVLFSVLVLTYGEECLDSQLGRIVKYMTISFLIASAAGYLMQLTGRSLYMRSTVYAGGTSTVRFAGLIGDSVFYAQCCALLVGANLVLACYHRSYRQLGLFFAIVLSGFCLLSYAKTGLLIIGAELLVYVFWQIGTKARSRRTLLFSVLIILAFVGGLIWLANYIMSDMSGTMVQNYLARFANADLLTGRLEIWEHYWNMLKSRWSSIFCAMPQSMFETPLVRANGRYTVTTHNIFIELVCAFGLVAAELILIWVLGVLVRSLRRRDGVLCLLPMLAMLASGMVLHGLFEYHYYTLVAIALAFLNYRPGGRAIQAPF